MKLPADYTPPTAHAWTGGSQPPCYALSPTPRRELISYLFREQVKCYAAYWSACPSLDTVRIFWTRAKHDAHAAIRNQLQQRQEVTQ